MQNLKYKTAWNPTWIQGKVALPNLSSTFCSNSHQVFQLEQPDVWKWNGLQEIGLIKDWICYAGSILTCTVGVAQRVSSDAGNSSLNEPVCLPAQLQTEAH